MALLYVLIMEEKQLDAMVMWRQRRGKEGLFAFI